MVSFSTHTAKWFRFLASTTCANKAKYWQRASSCLSSANQPNVAENRIHNDSIHQQPRAMTMSSRPTSIVCCTRVKQPWATHMSFVHESHRIVSMCSGNTPVLPTPPHAINWSLPDPTCAHPLSGHKKPTYGVALEHVTLSTSPTHPATTGPACRRRVSLTSTRMESPVASATRNGRTWICNA